MRIPPASPPTSHRVADDAALDSVLRLVAEGRLTAGEAGPIIDALEAREAGGPGPASGARASRLAETNPTTDDSPAKALRVEVREAGRTVINLRMPLSLGRTAISQVPGISEATGARIREAIEAGVKGPIVEVDDGGDTVRVSLE
jgi:hypothetical protein